MENNLDEILNKIGMAMLKEEFVENKETIRQKLHLKNESMAQKYDDFSLAWSSWSFVRKDMQLNLKAPDLFKIQKKMFLENLNNKAILLHEETSKHGIDIKEQLNLLGIEI